MAFSYNPVNLNTVTDPLYLVYQVRFEIGDTDSTVKDLMKRLEDEEIQFRLFQNGNDVLATAAKCCEDLMGKWVRREVGNLQHQNDQRFLWLAAKAEQLRERVVAEAPWMATGISIADKESAVEDTDRVAPAFSVDMLDNPNAIGGNPGIPGQETTDDELG